MRLILAAALLPLLAAPALAQSGARSPTSSGVVSGQNWNMGQDLRRQETAEAARRRQELMRRTQNRNYSGVPRPVTRGARPATPATPAN